MTDSNNTQHMTGLKRRRVLQGLGGIGVASLGGMSSAAVAQDGSPDVEWSDFEVTTLQSDLGNAMKMDITPDGRILYSTRGALFDPEIIEGEATITAVDPDTGSAETVLTLPVFTGHEDGGYGVAVDPDFEENGWVYFYYSPPNEEIAETQEQLDYLNEAALNDDEITKPPEEVEVQPYNRLSRFTMENGSIDPDSEVEIMRVHTQRDVCCHVGGSLAFDTQGNLYLSTGDDTNPFVTDGYAPIDETVAYYDAQRTAGNTNDLRGKILRITPQDDGSYTVPDDNLFTQSNGGSELPPVVGDASPLDPDDDGLYEDVNGDGSVGYDDGVDLFENYDAAAVQDNASAFDYNDNGRFDFDDIVEFFKSMGSDSDGDSDSDGNGSSPVPTGKVRPEIFVMGNRHPFTIAIDPETDLLYWGDYNESASNWSDEKGSIGISEFTRTDEAFNAGWPYFAGPNSPYIDYNYATGETTGEPFDPDNLVNESPHNTGLTELPPAKGPTLFYPTSWEAYLNPPEFVPPLPGDGEIPYPEIDAQSGAPNTGPIYRPKKSFGEDALPDAYDGTHFIMDWAGNWIKTVEYDDDGEVTDISPFLPNQPFQSPMNLEVGPDGALYLLTYGQGYDGTGGALYRIGYTGDADNDGCREVPTAIQQFAIRDLGETAAEEVRRVAEAGYDAIEFYQIDDLDAVKTALEEEGIEAAGIHLGLGDLEGSAFEDTVDRYTQLGTDNFVVASVDRSFFESEAQVMELADRFNAAADRLADEGLDFAYHNHLFEFQEVNGRSAFDVLVENTNENVNFQIDTGLAAAAGVDPAALITRLGDRVESIHARDMYVDVPEDEAQYVTDGVGYDFAELLNGDLDMEAIAAAARNDAMVDYLIYEHNTSQQAETLVAGIEALETLDTDEGCEDDETDPAN